MTKLLVLNPPKISKEKQGNMVAVFLPLDKARVLWSATDDALPENTERVPVDEMHVTLLYLGDDLSQWEMDAVEVVVEQISKLFGPFKVEINGVGAFNPGASPATFPIWAQVGSDELLAINSMLKDSLEMWGVSFPTDHLGYTPHITLAYSPTQSLDISIPTMDFVINELTVASGDKHISFPLALYDAGKKITLVVKKGGPGSGHRGHRGRPGKRGGALPGTGGDISKPERKFASGKAPSGEVLARISEGIYSVTPAGQDPRANIPLGAGLLTYPESDEWLDLSDFGRADVKDQIVTDISAASGVSYEDTNAVIGQWAQSSNDSDIRSLSLQEAASEEFGMELSDWQQTKVDTIRAAEWIRSDPMPGSDIDTVYDEAMKKYPNANDVYDIETTVYDQNMVEIAGGVTSPLLPRDQERAIMRAQYDQTQKRFADLGYSPDDSIVLYRGFTQDISKGTFDKGEIINYKGNTIESWSASPSVARNFANVWGADESGNIIRMEVPIRNVFSCARTGFGCLNEGEYVIFGNIPDSQAEVYWTTG